MLIVHHVFWSGTELLVPLDHLHPTSYDRHDHVIQVMCQYADVDPTQEPRYTNGVLPTARDLL